MGYKTYKFGEIKEQSYIDSVLDGIQREYGKLMEEYIIKDGRKNGLEKYYKNGCWEENYKDGKKDGLSKFTS